MPRIRGQRKGGQDRGRETGAGFIGAPSALMGLLGAALFGLQNWNMVFCCGGAKVAPGEQKFFAPDKTTTRS
jgi:hypothetical protein